jgi:hypothetical protein
VQKKMSKKDLIIEKVNEIVKKYDTKLSLRQIYYRLVSELVIENKLSQYKYLSKILVDARLNGLVSWDIMEDRVRNFSGQEHTWLDEPWNYEESSILYSIENSLTGFIDRTFNISKWYRQDHYLEVWVEKDALTNIFAKICDRKRVSLAVCKGYPSATYLHDAYLRIQKMTESDESPHITILYFGDYDPSGMDIERHIRDTLQVTYGIDCQVVRECLTLEQIKKYKLPPVPAKKSDTRRDKFVEEFGDQVVELDALEPDVLEEYIEQAIDVYYDIDKYKDESNSDELKEKTKNYRVNQKKVVLSVIEHIQSNPEFLEDIIEKIDTSIESE